MYDYNDLGNVISSVVWDEEQTVSAAETFSYDPTGAWLTMHYDFQGNQTKYVRNTEKPWLVEAIQMSVPGQGFSTVKSFTYYDEDDPDGLPGQVKTETVPDVGGTGLDQVTTYKYTENGHRRASPVETIYKDAAGVSRSSYSHYDAMGRLLSSTDADGRSVWYRYDAQGRQTLTVYKWVDGVVDGTPEVYTENHYDCCKLLWSRDENGNKTYYGYDDAKRLAKTWTDEQGGESYTGPPLVEYTYDAFGNQKTVKTRSDANTLRQTVYTYDNLNRVTKIEYPDGIVGDEEFGYTPMVGFSGRRMVREPSPSTNTTFCIG